LARDQHCYVSCASVDEQFYDLTVSSLTQDSATSSFKTDIGYTELQNSLSTNSPLTLEFGLERTLAVKLNSKKPVTDWKTGRDIFTIYSCVFRSFQFVCLPVKRFNRFRYKHTVDLLIYRGFFENCYRWEQCSLKIIFPPPNASYCTKGGALHNVTTVKWQQTNFSLVASFWGICLLSAFILLRLFNLTSMAIFHRYRSQRWRQVNRSSCVWAAVQKKSTRSSTH